jgi:phosphate butyryltransferase
MAERGQIKGAVVDGPLALDNAVSPEAARHKGIVSPVAGAADILLVPDIEAGNMLGKSMVYFARARVAGLVLGAAKPVVATSRADSAESKVLSIAMGALVSARTK